LFLGKWPFYQDFGLGRGEAWNIWTYFGAKKLLLIIAQQILPRNVKINKILRNWSDESVKNDHFTRISGSGAARLEIFEHILGWKVGTGNYPTNFAQKRGKNLLSLHFWINQLTLSWFLVDKIHCNVPGLPVDRFSIVKKHFFIITNNVKGFLLR
jgi:hypothetical protein